MPILEISAEENVPEWQEQEFVSTEQSPRNSRNSHGGPETKWWSKNYKKARQYLYGSEEIESDFVEAFRLFLQEAESGNALAMYDLGRMLADGLGREIDMVASQEWYGKALAAFRAEEQTAKEKQRPYLQYRIGKMHAAGLGTEQSYESAAKWFSQAADTNHKYAQYSLAGLYYRGQGVEQEYTRAFLLYQNSAEQGNPYASYELAKMYRGGIGTAKDSETAEQHFREAFAGFCRLEKESHDDKLQYRLGQMLYTGTGTERDDTVAAEYWQRAAKLGNVNAQYAIGKLWLENGAGDPEQAVVWLMKAAEGGNASAQYALGKMYRDGEHLEKDVKRAAVLFTQAAEQNHEYAAYALGKLYLCGHDVPRDKEKAIPLLMASATQGNIYAQFLLEHLDSFRDPSVFLAATRLMHRLENLFREDYKKATGATPFHIDRKRRRRLAEKKQAQGHKRDDQEPIQHYTY